MASTSPLRPGGGRRGEKNTGIAIDQRDQAIGGGTRGTLRSSGNRQQGDAGDDRQGKQPCSLS